MTETLACGYSSESTQGELSGTNMAALTDGFQKSLCLCALDIGSLSIGRVSYLSLQCSHIDMDYLIRP